MWSAMPIKHQKNIMVAIGREPTARGLKKGSVDYKPFACPYRRAPNGAIT